MKPTKVLMLFSLCLWMQNCNEENSEQRIQVQRKNCPIGELKYYEAENDSLIVGEILGWHSSGGENGTGSLLLKTNISQINLDFIYVEVDTAATVGFDSQEMNNGACLELKYRVQARGEENIFWSRGMKFINLTN